MRSEGTREQLLGPVGLAQLHVGLAHVEVGANCFVTDTCGCLAPRAGMCVLLPRKEQPSAHSGDTCVIKVPVGEVQSDCGVVPDSKTQAWWCNTREEIFCFVKSGQMALLSVATEVAVFFCSFYGCGMEALRSQERAIGSNGVSSAVPSDSSVWLGKYFAWPCRDKDAPGECGPYWVQCVVHGCRDVIVW